MHTHERYIKTTFQVLPVKSVYTHVMHSKKRLYYDKLYHHHYHHHTSIHTKKIKRKYINITNSLMHIILTRCRISIITFWVSHISILYKIYIYDSLSLFPCYHAPKKLFLAFSPDHSTFLSFLSPLHLSLSLMKRIVESQHQQEIYVALFFSSLVLMLSYRLCNSIPLTTPKKRSCSSFYLQCSIAQHSL